MWPALHPTSRGLSHRQRLLSYHHQQAGLQAKHCPGLHQAVGTRPCAEEASSTSQQALKGRASRIALTGLRQAVGGCPCSQGLQQLRGGYRGAAPPQAWLQWGDGHSAGILQLEHKFFTHLACSTHGAAGFMLWPAVHNMMCLAQSLPEGGSPRKRSQACRISAAA